MSAQLELDQSEIELIEARRKEKAAKAEAKRLEDEAKEKARLKKEAIIKAKIEKLKDELRAADTNGILFEDDKGNLKFMIGARTDSVEISEHIVYTSRSFRGTNKGMKYRLYGEINDYKERWYKNPKSVIERIEEAQEIARNVAKREQIQETLNTRAFTQLTKDYPNAEVTFEKGYDYSTTRRSNYAPDRVKVKTDNGWYEFSYRDSDDGIIFSVWKRGIDKSIDDQVRKLILG